MNKLAYGVGGTDWQERINFPRMRKERLAKTQALMKKYGIAASLLTRPENIEVFQDKNPNSTHELRKTRFSKTRLGFVEK